MKLHILHLADLHVSARDQVYLSELSQALQNDLATLAKKDLKVDFVCITGDLIDKGEYAAAELQLLDDIFIRPLQKNLWLPHSHFFFCPGNHDVDRNETSQSLELGFAHTVNSEESFRSFYNDALKHNVDYLTLQRKLKSYFTYVRRNPNPNKTFESFFCDTYELEKHGVKIGIASLNSAWRCSSFGSDDKRLIIGEHVITEAASRVAHCDLRVCLVHHPLEMLAPWDFKPVQQKMAKAFHIVMDGHVHESDTVCHRRLLGSSFVSTAGCMRPNESFSSYTLLEVDLAADVVTAHFRKWYREREAFDEDTAKAHGGKASFPGITRHSPIASASLQISMIRGNLQLSAADGDVVCPIEGIDDVALSDVFVEPLLADKSSFDRDAEAKTLLNLCNLLRSEESLIFAGRPEFGKTTLLKYARDFILTEERHFEGKFPVFFRFRDLPRSNPASVLKSIVNQIGKTYASEIESFAESGRLIILIDDFNDRQDPQHERRAQTFREFARKYSKCRCILTVNEHLSQPMQMELLATASDFSARLVYMDCLKTAHIRKLLQNWSAMQAFDVDAILSQMLFYFNRFQIPVTPLAVTLFLGVLFRRKREKNIRNEAYLIENYLETLLEKLNPSERDADLDFRDKEDFLAVIAWTMVNKDRTEMLVNEFEQCKIDYFNTLDEDIPHHSLFDAFFRKGILVQEDGVISFRRQFWLHFFVAKALEKSAERESAFLKSKHVYKFGKALVYKAGLSRNDIGLLSWVDEAAMNEANTLIDRYRTLELRDAGIDAPFEKIALEIEQEIKAKNADSEVDLRRDEIFLKYDDDKGELDEEVLVDFADLVTLQSDLIRNSPQIAAADKHRLIGNNVACYVAMMWGAFEGFRDTLQVSSEEELLKLFFKGSKDASVRQKLKYVLEQAQRIVHQVVPLSILLYMSDHLGTPRLLKSFERLADKAKSATEKLFYRLLIFSQKPKTGVKELKNLVSPTSSATEDFIIYGFMRCYCYENKVEDDVLNKIVAIMEFVQRKYAQRSGIRSTSINRFRASMKKKLMHLHKKR